MLIIVFARPLKLKGITVNAVNPCPTDTGWMTDEIKTPLTSKSLKFVKKN